MTLFRIIVHSAFIQSEFGTAWDEKKVILVEIADDRFWLAVYAGVNGLTMLWSRKRAGNCVIIHVNSIYGKNKKLYVMVNDSQ